MYNYWRVLFTESKRGVRPPPGLPPPWRNPQSSDCSRGFRLPAGTARGSSRTSPRARRPRRGFSQRDGPWRLRPAPHAAPSGGHEAGRHPPHGFPPALQTSAPRARPAGRQRARPPQVAVTATAHLPRGAERAARWGPGRRLDGFSRRARPALHPRPSASRSRPRSRAAPSRARRWPLTAPGRGLGCRAETESSRRRRRGQACAPLPEGSPRLGGRDAHGPDRSGPPAASGW